MTESKLGNFLKKFRGMDMLHGSIWDKALAFAVPLALTSILQQLYNAEDVLVLGHWVGPEAMAGVGNNIPVLALIINLFIGLSLGANVVMARSLGQGDPRGCRRAMGTGVWLALASGIAVMACGLFLVDAIMRWMDVPPEAVESAETYLRWSFIAMPFISLFNFESAFFRSIGNTSEPLAALAIASCFNIAGNLAAVMIFDAGVNGVAASTVASYALSAAWLWMRLARRRDVLRLDREALSCFDARKAWAAFAIGMPAGVQGMVFAASNLVIQSAINSLGAETMAASAAAFTIENNVYCFVNAFGMAATTFIGQNYGAGNLERCRRVTSVIMAWDVGACCALAFSVGAISPWLLGFFTDSQEVVDIAMQRIFFVLLPQGINAVTEVFSDSMRGYGYSLPPALTALLCICGERLLWVWLVFPSHRSYGALMITYPISWAITSFLLFFLYRHCVKSFVKPQKA
jgi:putative MATE family efflux protein